VSDNVVAYGGNMSCYLSVLICFLYSYGPIIDTLPIPEVDLDLFLKGVEKEAQNHPQTWDPLTEKLKPFIDTKTARKTYHKGSKCTIH
jgi:hypothetical protein